MVIFWYYREEGLMQYWEDPDEYTRKIKRKRLSVTAIERYFQTYAGFNIPSWASVQFDQIVGLERSVHELQVPITHFDTAWDIK